MTKTALLVIDIQEALVQMKPYLFDDFFTKVHQVINYAAESNMDIIYVQHTEDSGDLEIDSPGWKLYHQLTPNSSDYLICKKYNSAFKETSLDQYLRDRKINQLIIVGMQTEYCIDTTVKVAFEKGYQVLIPLGTNTTFDNPVISAKDMIYHYNHFIFNGNFAKLIEIDKLIK